MIPLFSKNDLDNSKSKDFLPLECLYCHKKYFKQKYMIQDCILCNEKVNKNRKTSRKLLFCSIKCKNHYYRGEKQIVICKNCNKELKKFPNQIKKTKNNFCSRSCSATYNNQNKTNGIKRSKLEIWIEKQLTILYPDLEIKYNKKDAINSELDIYIPSLKLAFELNGIYHYEPIHGINKMNQIQNNDHRKILACAENEISLCLIDISQQKYFKEQTSKKYLDIIKNIINQAT